MKKYIPIAIIVGLSILFFWKFFFQGLLPIPSDTIVGLYHPFRDYYVNEYPNGIPFKNFLITDPVRQQIPWRKLSIDALRTMQLPGWNPYTFTGTPLAANYQSAVFYPLNFILFILPFHVGWSVLVILQPVLAGVFMYLYLRKMRISIYGAVCGGMVYGYSGVSIAWLTWNTLGHVALWLPFVLFIKEQILALFSKAKFSLRDITLPSVLLIAAETMYILAGHVQVAFYVFVISNVYLLSRVLQIYYQSNREIGKNLLHRSSIFFAVSWLCVAAITAVQTIPFLQFVARSGRGTDLTHNEEGWFIPWKHLFQFLAPDFFGNPATLNYWGTWNYGELVGYVGVIPLLLVFVSLWFIRRKMVLFFAVGALVALVFSTDNVVARLPYLLDIPLVSTSQPTRLLFVVSFCFAVLAAIGLDVVLNKKISTKKFLWTAGIVIVLYGVAWGTVYSNFLTNNIDDLLVSRRNLVIPTTLASIGILLIMLMKSISVYRSVLIWLILIVTVADLFRFGWKFIPFTDSNYLFPTNPTIEYLQSQPGVFRIMSTDDRILPANFSSVYELQTIDGYDPLYLRNYSELSSAIIRNTPDISPFSFNRMISLRNPDHKIIDMMNVKYVLSLTDLNVPHLIKVHEEGITKIYENARVFPRAYLVSHVIYTSDKTEAIKIMFEEEFNFVTTAVVNSEVDVPSIPLSSNENVAITEYTNNMVELRSNTAESRLVVLSDTYYPNWEAFVDGEKVPIHQVNYAFRGVVVPRGEHTVKFIYNLL